MLAPLADASGVFPAVLTACSMAAACAVLSVFVVSRRWAFIGEGISHSGFGGAGTVWLLALFLPALDKPWVPYLGVVAFCLITALAIGYFTRGRGAGGKAVNSDAAIGIFMVASLAWGFVAQGVYTARHAGRAPAGWDTFLFGRMDTSPLFAVASAVACVSVVAVVVLLGKEILSYCFDPAMAEASGVRVGFIHYLLMVLVALTIVLGVRVVGNVLVTALLVLPGATALLLSERFRSAVTASVGVGLAGALVGLTVNAAWPALPVGPAIVLALFAQFVLAFAWAKARRR